ncbi:MAG: CPBP family intramembrane metalloprotease [Bacteroidales bacterium]|nr:CPBP family intramembrane metalloprotease [Bacteroidales bacterium]
MKKYLVFIKHSSFWTKIIFFCLLILISLLLTTFLGLIIAYPFADMNIVNALISGNTYTENNINILKYLQIINQIGLFLLPALLFSLVMNNNFSEYLNINKKPKIKNLILSILIIFFSFPFINFLVEINQNLSLPAFLSSVEDWMKASEEEANTLSELFVKANTYRGLIINVIIIALLPAISEEFFFRGVLLRLFKEKIKSVHIAVLISAIVFSALHLQFYTFLPRVFLGLILGYLYLWTGSLWVPIFTHFINNAIAVIGTFLLNNKLVNFDAENFSQSNIFLLLFSSLMVIYFIKEIYKNKKGDIF